MPLSKMAKSWSVIEVSVLKSVVSNSTIIYLDSGVYSSGSAMSDHDYEQLYPLTLLSFEQLSKLNLIFVIKYTNRNETYTTKTYVIRNSSLGYTGAWYDIQMYVAWFIQNFTISKNGIANHTY